MPAVRNFSICAATAVLLDFILQVGMLLLLLLVTYVISCKPFFLGSLTPMPAVRNFSICAATAVLLDFHPAGEANICY
jgi:hypothetical protein